MSYGNFHNNGQDPFNNLHFVNFPKPEDFPKMDFPKHEDFPKIDFPKFEKDFFANFPTATNFDHIGHTMKPFHDNDYKSEDSSELVFKIIAIIVAIVAVVCLAVILIRFCRRQRELNKRRRNTDNIDLSDDPHWISKTFLHEIHTRGVFVGMDEDGDKIYVGRALKRGDLLAAKIVPRKDRATVSYNGNESIVEDYQILVDMPHKWVHTCTGQVPPFTISTGFSKDGEILYIGRATWRGSVIPGKIHPSHGCLYIPYAGNEIRIEYYEALVEIDPTTVTPDEIGWQSATVTATSLESIENDARGNDYINNVNSMMAFMRQQNNLDIPAPIVVTSSTHQPAGGYPVTVQATSTGGFQVTPYGNTTTFPMPQPGQTAPAAAPYPTNTPYPVNTTMPMPQATSGYPHPQGFVPAPYPPAASHPSSDPNSNPPSYDQVVGDQAYNKQSAYNPHFTG